MTNIVPPGGPANSILGEIALSAPIINRITPKYNRNQALTKLIITIFHQINEKVGLKSNILHFVA